MRHVAAAAFAIAVAAGACATATVAQSTWLVDDTPGTGVHFTSLPIAVAAAASGDTLLVAAGSYEPFLVSGKALTIAGAGSGATVIDRPPPVAGPDYVAIDAVPAGAVFRLSGLRITRDLGTQVERLVLRGSGAATSGAVVLDSVATGPVVSVFTSSPVEGPGLHARGLLVHAHRCSFTGGASNVAGALVGYAGARADGGAVLIANACTMTGGSVTALGSISANGGAGMFASDALCHCFGSQLQGGGCVIGFPFGSAVAGHGAQASGNATVHIVGAGSDAVRGGNAGGTYTGGGNGIVCASPAAVAVHGPVVVAAGIGPSGPALQVWGSTITLGLLALPRLQFTGAAGSSGTLLAGQPVTLEVDRGLPGGLVVVLADAQPGGAPLPGLSAEPLLLGPGLGIATFSWLDALGTFSLTAVPATQLPYLLGLPTHWQAFVWDAAAGAWWGSNAELLRLQP